MNSGVSIIYGDIAPEAKENFVPTATDKKFDTLGNLQKYNMQLYNYASPCEYYNTLLDGSAVAFPSDSTTANIGLWSNQLSNNLGAFSPAVQLTLTSSGQYSSQGFTFTFDKFNNIYPNKLRIQWIRDTGDAYTDLGTKEFMPDNAFYFCKNAVENFNKVNITFISMNMPFSRLKVESIDFGYGTVFYGDELRNVKITHSLNPISSEIAINTCDFSLDSHTDIEYSFQAKQPLTVKFNDNVVATTFVKSSKRNARFLWMVSGEDYIGLMDTIPFVGGMYNNTKAGALLETIFKTAKVPYSIDEDFYDVPLYGYIPYTTCRNALMQVAFACQAVVDTSYSDVVKVFSLPDTVSQTIPLNRIMQGQSFTDEDTVTGVEVTCHTYTPKTEILEVYKAEESGIGDNLTIIFPEPLHDLVITNGTIIEHGTNYAKINANVNCVLSGQKYEHMQQIKRKTNDKVLASEPENVKSITNATLISPNNIDIVLEKCYNWLIRINSTNLKIVEGKTVIYGKPVLWGEKKWGTFKWGDTNPDQITYDEPVNVGDKITAKTEYLGAVTGTIIKESFNLNGNIVIKEAVLK